MFGKTPVLGSPQDWLRHARSDLALARQKASGVLLEQLCFHCQQAAEKALKAVLVARGTTFPFTHNIGVLITLAAEADSECATRLEDAAELTHYAVQLRYPGFRDVTDAEYEKALQVASEVVDWASAAVEVS